jgi:ribosome-associated protein
MSIPESDFLPDEGEAERPSKSALKREAHELQKLGQELIELPDARLAAIPMEERLLSALKELKKTKSHEGRRRQLQYVGKLMRFADVEPLREAVSAFKLGHAQDAVRLHHAERWRAELVADTEALTRWMQKHPDSDAQRLRSLIRAAQKDAALPPEQRHGRAWRELFQFIKPELRDDE